MGGVSALSSGIDDFSQWLRGFRNKILPDGTLEDHASPELARIRREIEKQKRQIQESLRGYLRRLSEGGAVQDELVTIRGERFVIPVKVEQKRRVQGVVHGASSSGQTVFVEPLETIEQNNELVRLLDEEHGGDPSHPAGDDAAHWRERGGDSVGGCEVLAELELQFAKARFAEDYECVRGDSCCSRRGSQAACILRNARHPLLERNLKAKGAAGRCRSTIELEGEQRRTGHHRPEHRRQNCRAENRGTAGADGAGGNAGSGRSRRIAGV